MTSILLFAFLAASTVMILVWVHFSDYGSSILVLTTLLGRHLNLTIWPMSGRFWLSQSSTWEWVWKFSPQLLRTSSHRIANRLFHSNHFDTDLGMTAASAICWRLLC
jgi:hypothetical protein